MEECVKKCEEYWKNRICYIQILGEKCCDVDAFAEVWHQ